MFLQTIGAYTRFRPDSKMYDSESGRSAAIFSENAIIPSKTEYLPICAGSSALSRQAESFSLISIIDQFHWENVCPWGKDLAIRRRSSRFEFSIGSAAEIYENTVLLSNIGILLPCSGVH